MKAAKHKKVPLSPEAQAQIKRQMGKLAMVGLAEALREMAAMAEELAQEAQGSEPASRGKEA